MNNYPVWMLPMLPACVLFGFAALMPSSSSSLERGDEEFARGNYPLALAVYDSVLITSTDSAGVLWRLARLYVCLGDVAPEGQQLDLYRRAEGFAKRSICSDSTKSEGHSWRAAALGNVAVFEGSKAKVRLCTVIKQELVRAIALNPQDDIAYSILGSFYMALGNISWLERRLATLFLGELPEGGYDESERALRQAVALAPQIIRHHFELGTLFKELDRNEEALQEFRQVLSLPPLLASDAARQLSAARLVKDLEGE
jgi:tetratricopeptide (TPR) repeat protein